MAEFTAKEKGLLAGMLGQESFDNPYEGRDGFYSVGYIMWREGWEEGHQYRLLLAREIALAEATKGA